VAGYSGRHEVVVGSELRCCRPSARMTLNRSTEEWTYRPVSPRVVPTPDPTPNSVPTAMVWPSALTSMLVGYQPVGNETLQLPQQATKLHHDGFKDRDGVPPPVSGSNTRPRSGEGPDPVAPFRCCGIRTGATGIVPLHVRVVARCRRTLGGGNAVAVYSLPAAQLKGLRAHRLVPDEHRRECRWATPLPSARCSAWGRRRDDPGADGPYVHSYVDRSTSFRCRREAELAAYTTSVAQNKPAHPYTPAPSRAARATLARAPFRAAREPSLIDHVVYIVHENRTY